MLGHFVNSYLTPFICEFPISREDSDEKESTKKNCLQLFKPSHILITYIIKGKNTMKGSWQQSRIKSIILSKKVYMNI